jgi:hypothetical protein
MEQQHSQPGDSSSAQIELTRTNLSEEFRHTGMHPTLEETNRIRTTISALLSCDQFSVTFSAKGVDFGGAVATAVRAIYNSNVTPHPSRDYACIDMIMHVRISLDVTCHYKTSGSRVLQIRVDREMNSRDMDDLIDECAYACIRSRMKTNIPIAKGGGVKAKRTRYEDRVKLHAHLLSKHAVDGGTVTGEDAEKLLHVTFRRTDRRYADALVHLRDGSTRMFSDIFSGFVLRGIHCIGDVSNIVKLQGNPFRVFMQLVPRSRNPKSLVNHIATSDTKKMRIKEDDEDEDEDDDKDDDDKDGKEDNVVSYKTAFLADVALGLSNQPGKWEAINRVSDFIEKTIECQSKDIAEVVRLAKERRDAQSRRAAAKEEHEKAQAALSQLRNKLQIAHSLFD